MPREYKFLPLVLSLIAGLSVSVKFILQRDFSINCIIIILSVLLGFYILGLIARAVLIKLKTPEPEEEEEAVEEGEIPDVTTASEEETTEE